MLYIFVHFVLLRETKAKGCFALDTLVTLSDGSWKAIGEIERGEHVRSWDPVLRSTSSAQVLQVPRFWQENLITIQLGANSKNRIHATADHPFWSHRAKQIVSRDPVLTTQSYGLQTAWLEEKDFFENEFGDPVEVLVSANISALLSDTGLSEHEAHRSHRLIQVATLSLDRHHWFFVHGVRAHNKGGGGGGGSGAGGGGSDGGSGGDGGCDGPVCFVLIGGCGAGFVIFGGIAGMNQCGKREASKEFQARTMARQEFAREVAETGAASSDGAIPPSGEWAGTYKEDSSGEKAASYTLTFKNDGCVYGEGRDSDGTYTVNGTFSLKSGTVKWTETYSWGSIELTGTIKLDLYYTCIQASFVSSLCITGSILIMPKGHGNLDLQQPQGPPPIVIMPQGGSSLAVRQPGEVEEPKTIGNAIEQTRSNEINPNKEMNSSNEQAPAMEMNQNNAQPPSNEMNPSIVHPPSLETNPLWRSHSKPNIIMRTTSQTALTLARIRSGKKLGERLQNQADLANSQLGASKLELTNDVLRNNSKAAVGNGLPPDWTVEIDTTYNTGMPYYFNTVTKETQWTRPQ